MRWFHVEPTGPVIPTPQAGVCTPYPIPIPVTSGLLSYTSCFNSCDIYQRNDVTNPITATNQRAAYVNDLSVLGNDVYSWDLTKPTEAPFDYVDNGGGDVYFRSNTPGATYEPWTIGTALRYGNGVKTFIALVKLSDAANFIMGFHYNNGRLNINTSTLAISFRSAGSFFNSSLNPVLNQWVVVSLRTNNNLVYGNDKMYNQFLNVAPVVDNSNFYIYTDRGVTVSNSLARETAIYSNSISDAEMDAMVDYMKAKWGL